MGRAINQQGLGSAAALALLVGMTVPPAQAQEAPPVQPMLESPGLLLPPAAPAAPLGTSQCPFAAAPCIPALTPVKLVIRAHLGSKISTSGQTFPIALAAPIMVDGKELIPAGTTGKGEVVHAKKSGGSGASGELILAARYLDVGERRLRLRSLNFAVAGQDAMGTVQSINIASAVAFPALSLIGFFIQGKGIDIPDGVEAMAKTAEPFVLDPLSVAAAAIEAAPVSPPLEQGTTP